MYLSLKHFRPVSYLIGFLLFINLTQARGQELSSPDGLFRLTFQINQAGTPTYQLNYKGKALIKPSKLGFDFKKEIKGTDFEKAQLNLPEKRIKFPVQTV